MGELLEIGDKISLLTDITKRAALMAFEIQEDFLTPLVIADDANDFIRVRIMTHADATHALLKAEILTSLIDDISVGLDELEREARDQDAKIQEAPTRDDYGDHTEDEIKNTMIDEYLNSINDFVSVIGDKPDFIHRMTQLKKAARILAGNRDVEVVEKS